MSTQRGHGSRRAGAGGTITDVGGVLAGHARDRTERTGVTALLFNRPTRGAVEVRGGAPGTFGTDALAPLGCFGTLGGLFLSGGSLFGLDAAKGVRRCVLERGGGIRVFGSHDRLVGVAGAILFDLPRTQAHHANYEELGYRAARSAGPRPLPSGSVGAGTGATVGKLLGRARSMRGGVGSASRLLPGGGHIGALVAVNSVGNVIDPAHGTTVAGARSPGTGFASPSEAFRELRQRVPREMPRGTNLLVVVTDHPVGRRDLGRTAQAAHDALARVVVPAHTATDGDTAFALCTAPEPSRSKWPGRGGEPYPGATADLLGILAAECVVEAVLRAVRAARGTPDLPAVQDLRTAGTGLVP